MNDRAILAIDLSTTHGQVALRSGGDVLYEAAFQSERSHNAKLFGPLREALEIAGSKLDLIVVGTGPGSYTGVRIGIAAAQGVGLSRGAPVIGWPSIAAPNSKYDHYQVIGDARRGACYVARVTGGLLDASIAMMDAGSARAIVETRAGERWISFDAVPPMGLAQVELVRPSAVRLAELASALTDDELRIRESLVLEPFYLQEAFITTARKAGKQVPATH